MDINELIERLEAIRNNYGNLKVKIAGPDGITTIDVTSFSYYTLNDGRYVLDPRTIPDSVEIELW